MKKSFIKRLITAVSVFVVMALGSSSVFAFELVHNRIMTVDRLAYCCLRTYTTWNTVNSERKAWALTRIDGELDNDRITWVETTIWRGARMRNRSYVRRQGMSRAATFASCAYLCRDEYREKGDYGIYA